MRKLMWLAVFIAVTPLASWASGAVGFQSARGGPRDGSFASTRWSGSFAGANLGTFALNGKFDGKGLGFEGERNSLDGKNYSFQHENSKGEDDDRGDDGGKIALPVPEPGTLSLLGAGLVALAGAVRRRVSV